MTCPTALVPSSDPALRCAWTLDLDTDCCDVFDTGCGEKFVFFEGGPTENKMKFCPYCGLNLVEAKTEPAVEDDDD